MKKRMYRQRLRALKMKRVLRKKELTAHSSSKRKKSRLEKNLKKGLPLAYLPKLGADLVTALTGLNVDDFTVVDWLKSIMQASVMRATRRRCARVLKKNREAVVHLACEMQRER
jgi:hypothetical protein